MEREKKMRMNGKVKERRDIFWLIMFVCARLSLPQMLSLIDDPYTHAAEAGGRCTTLAATSTSSVQHDGRDFPLLLLL